MTEFSSDQKDLAQRCAVEILEMLGQKLTYKSTSERNDELALKETNFYYDDSKNGDPSLEVIFRNLIQHDGITKLILHSEYLPNGSDKVLGNILDKYNFEKQP